MGKPNENVKKTIEKLKMHRLPDPYELDLIIEKYGINSPLPTKNIDNELIAHKQIIQELVEIIEPLLNAWMVAKRFAENVDNRLSPVDITNMSTLEKSAYYLARNEILERLARDSLKAIPGHKRKGVD